MRLELWEGLLAEAEDKRLSDRKSLKPDRLELAESAGSLRYGIAGNPLHQEPAVVGCLLALLLTITLYNKGMRPSITKSQKQE